MGLSGFQSLFGRAGLLLNFWRSRPCHPRGAPFCTGAGFPCPADDHRHAYPALRIPTRSTAPSKNIECSRGSAPAISASGAVPCRGLFGGTIGDDGRSTSGVLGQLFDNVAMPSSGNVCKSRLRYSRLRHGRSSMIPTGRLSQPHITGVSASAPCRQPFGAPSCGTDFVATGLDLCSVRDFSALYQALPSAMRNCSSVMPVIDRHIGWPSTATRSSDRNMSARSFPAYRLRIARSPALRYPGHSSGPSAHWCQDRDRHADGRRRIPAISFNPVSDRPKHQDRRAQSERLSSKA